MQPIPRICDFGVSQDLQSQENEVSVRRFGTSLYAAPELRETSNTIQTDIYAFGCTLQKVLIWILSWSGFLNCLLR